MTDQTIPAGVSPDEAKKAREWALNALNKPGASTTAEKAIARLVLNAVPEPRPTLADMTEEERAACKWMQADVETWGRAVIVLPNERGGRTVTLNRRGHMAYEDHTDVTPRPDLPRLEWPGNQKPAPVPALPEGWRLADHPDHGRIVVTNTTPNSDGDVYFVIPAENPLGYDWYICALDELTFLDTGQEADQ